MMAKRCDDGDSRVSCGGGKAKTTRKWWWLSYQRKEMNEKSIEKIERMGAREVGTTKGW